LPPKKEVALALLERSNVDVYLDPRAKGVVVPPQFRKEPRLILKIGLNMPVPIPDLRLDDESMSCTLSFNRSPFYCVVPWSSVFAMVGEDGRGMVWPDDVPQELAVKVVEPNDAGPRAPGSPASHASHPSQSAREGAPNGAPARRGARGAHRDRSAPTATAGAGPVERERGGRGAKADPKKKKKKDEGRPVLVAVPPLASSVDQRDAREADGDRGQEQSPERGPDQAPASDARPPPHPASDRPGPERRDGVSPIQHSVPNRPMSAPRQPLPPSQRRPDGTAARPKRELPPYLRVVK
jgi:stringent starvation protein B